MKYLIVLASGMADEPLAELGGRTPLAAAHKPALDELARDGKIGCVRTLPEPLPASEEVALLSALGFNPEEFFTGEAGLAVADSGLKVGPGQLAFIHNLATEANGVLVDHAAGQISLKEAEVLLTSLAAAFGRPDAQFWAGQGFAGVTVLPVGEEARPICDPPEAALGAQVGRRMPHGEGSELLVRLMELSRETFLEHEVNRVRTDLGENPANLLWLWGPGKPPALPSFESRHKLTGTMIAAAESARGLGRLCGMRVPHVAGATGGYRTDYTAKAQAALEAVHEADLAVVHVASPAEASLEGNVQRKISAIQDIDAMIVAPLLQHARSRADTRMMFLCTHLASAAQRRRLREPVPVAMFGPGLEPFRRGAFSEAAAQAGELGVEHGHDLLQYFLTR
jgi:2,3-bisphosphoglycerate-independent phosphoglycerate mutase